jgi:hypothetical protein
MNDIINCKTIRECENIFLTRIDSIKLLGDIYLNEDELTVMTRLIKDSLKNIIYNYSLYKQKTPLTISLFLVWKGVYEYQCLFQ